MPPVGKGFGLKFDPDLPQSSRYLSFAAPPKLWTDPGSTVVSPPLGNNVGPEGVKIICKALKHNTSLRELNLSGMYFAFARHLVPRSSPVSLLERQHDWGRRMQVYYETARHQSLA